MQCIFIMESIDPLMPISYIVIKDKTPYLTAMHVFN